MVYFHFVFENATQARLKTSLKNFHLLCRYTFRMYKKLARTHFLQYYFPPLLHIVACCCTFHVCCTYHVLLHARTRKYICTPTLNANFSRAARVSGGPGLSPGRGLQQDRAGVLRPLPETHLRRQRGVQSQHPQANLHLQAGIRGQRLRRLR